MHDGISPIDVPAGKWERQHAALLMCWCPRAERQALCKAKSLASRGELRTRSIAKGALIETTQSAEARAGWDGKGSRAGRPRLSVILAETHAELELKLSPESVDPQGKHRGVVEAVRQQQVSVTG